MTYQPTPTDTSIDAVRTSIDRQLAKADLVTLTRGQIEAVLAAIAPPQPGIED